MKTQIAYGLILFTAICCAALIYGDIMKNDKIWKYALIIAIVVDFPAIGILYVLGSRANAL